MKRGLISTILGVALVASAGAAWAGTVGITVKNADGPVAGAVVKIGKAGTTTDRRGVAVLEDIAGGTHTVEVIVTCHDAAGQVTAIRRASKEVKVGDDESVAATLQVERCPRAVAPPKSEEEDPGEE